MSFDFLRVLSTDLMRLPPELIGIIYDKLFRLRDKASLKCVNRCINDAFEYSDKSLYLRAKQWLASHAIIREIKEVFYGYGASENSMVVHNLREIEYKYERWSFNIHRYHNKFVVFSAGRQMTIWVNTDGILNVFIPDGMPHTIRGAYSSSRQQLSPSERCCSGNFLRS